MIRDLMSDPTMTTALTKFNNPSLTILDRAKNMSPRKYSPSPNLTLP